MKTVAILGTGPAGLMAAHACKLAGVPFHLFGLGQKSIMGGAQFLHHAVPLLHNAEEPEFYIRYRLTGNARSYAQKVYGNAEIPFVSFNNVFDGEVQPAWSLQKVYDILWEDIAGGGSSINEMNIGPVDVVNWIDDGTFGLIVSTVPKQAVCLSHNMLIQVSHGFWSQMIRVIPECIFDTDLSDNTIMYDGTPNVSWYRTSRINGIGSTEWGSGAPDTLPYKNIAQLKKPINTTCSCFEGEVLFTGRHGAWKKGLLVHHAFTDTWKALQ